MLDSVWDLAAKDLGVDALAFSALLKTKHVRLEHLLLAEGNILKAWFEQSRISD